MIIKFKLKLPPNIQNLKIKKIVFDKDTALVLNCIEPGFKNYPMYMVDSINGRDPEKDEVNKLKWMELTKVVITCDGKVEDFDASELDALDITQMDIDGVYVMPRSLYRYQHTTLPIKGVSTILTKYEYEEIAKVIRENDQKEYAHNALENYDDISENTKQILEADSKFPEAFDKATFDCISAQNEAEAIDEYLDENFGSEISANFISNKGTENEIVQEVRLPEIIMDHLIDDIMEKNNGTAIDPIILPVIYDEWGDEVDLQYVDEIIKN